MFSEAAPRPRSRHSPCWGPSRLVRSSPSSCLTRNGCFIGFFLIIFPPFPSPFPLSSVQSPFVLFVTPPALVGVTWCKGTQCGRGCLSKRPSTYPLGRAPTSLRGPGLWCLALCTPAILRWESRRANINANSSRTGWVLNLRTFAPIATAHLQCASYSLVTHVPRHFQARARSPKLNKI